MDNRIDQPGYTILTSPPIYDRLYEYCTPGLLRRIARTCRGAEEAVNEYLTHALSVRWTTQLARFFPKPEDVNSFRQLQANLQFLVSGSQALQLLGRTVYRDSDLDVYVWPDQAQPVAQWVRNRGYQFVPNEQSSHSTFERALEDMLARRGISSDPEDWHLDGSYDSPGIRWVFNFKKRRVGTKRSTPLSDDTNVETVQIIVTRTSPLKTILRFYSTVVMNFVAWDRAVSLYPKGTFRRRAGLLTDTGAMSGCDAAVLKYKKRGFSIQEKAHPKELKRLPFPIGGRWVGDGHTWTVKLSTANIKHPAAHTRWEPGVNSWVLSAHDTFSYRANDPGGSYSFETVFDTIGSKMFRYCYCATPNFLDFLEARLGGGDKSRVRLSEQQMSNMLAVSAKGRSAQKFWDTRMPRHKAAYIDHLRKKKPRKRSHGRLSNSDDEDRGMAT